MLAGSNVMVLSENLFILLFIFVYSIITFPKLICRGVSYLLTARRIFVDPIWFCFFLFLDYCISLIVFISCLS
jgi:hypothetical protein